MYHGLVALLVLLEMYFTGRPNPVGESRRRSRYRGAREEKSSHNRLQGTR
jgi:hypothetical protein